MNVSACLVTRGDVDMQPIFDSLPKDWEKVVWVNHSRDHSGKGEVIVIPIHATWPTRPAYTAAVVSDLSVYGRYAAIEYASHDLIYVQDDDAVVSDPQAIVDALILNVKERSGCRDDWPEFWNHVVCNMPPEFRHDFYRDHALVGFGAAFHRDAPKRAFDKYGIIGPGSNLWIEGIDGLDPVQHTARFLRDCDLVFTALTPRVLVDVPKQNLPWAEDADRLYRQRDHQAKRERMLELALKVRDA